MSRRGRRCRALSKLPISLDTNGCNEGYDRVLCQLCVRGAGSFTPDELIEEVICTMIVNEENISKVARTYIRIHIIYLRSRYLLVRDKDEDGKVYPAERLAAELERIPRNMLDNDPTKMKKYADLVKIGAYPLKRLTVKELRQRLLEMQDERDDLRQDRDRLLKECEDLKAELADAREGRTAAEKIPMDVDAEEEAHEAAPGTPSQVNSQSQSNAVALRRTPTLDYIDPVTPPRRKSTNASQYLLTPPDTDERPRKRLSKTGSRAQQVSFRDDNLNTGLAMDASNVSGRSGTHELTTPQTDLTSSMLEDVIDAGRREMNGIFERMAAAATAEREGNALREQTLQNDKAI
ncbi:hypothetical protein OH76DRAFT_676512 [Lentinus brumalis]|uniref:Uncharacterized protein n=1 Tax=Lentinus brumalis TaxID=2498619 RepID=A0A371D6F9_9APHY|nr:hypothetical protein OH76DRAFT_676512 [Polyporus brumalis]